MVKKFEDSRDFTYLSEMYGYIEQFGKKGHQIGRKIGDMLEIVTMAYCFKNASLKDRMKTEIALKGFTDAEHKVEFSFFRLDKENKFIMDSAGDVDQNNLLGFIECKKVGVEVTVHSETREKEQEIELRKTYEYNLSPRWLDRSIKFKISCLEINDSEVKIKVESSNSKEPVKSKQHENEIKEEIKFKPEERFLITILEDGTLAIIKPDENLSHIHKKIRLCHVFTLKRINRSAFFKIETCLTGPQTIEKAKQSALVALDVRKKITGKWGKEQLSKEDNLKTILVIGEVSHWENKSRRVVIKTIDYNLVVPDYILIQAFEKFYEEFGDSFLNHISKDSFKNDEKVRELINQVLEENNDEIFYDLESLNFKKIDLQRDKLIVRDL